MTGSNNGGTDSSDDPSLTQDIEWQQAAQRMYEPDRDGELTKAIVFALADADGVPPNELKSPPLYEMIDVPAIEKVFFRSTSTEFNRQVTGVIEFRYIEYLVNVRSDGRISVYEQREPDPV